MNAGCELEGASSQRAQLAQPEERAPRVLRVGGAELTLRVSISDKQVSLSLEGLAEAGQHYSDSCAERTLSLLPKPSSLKTSEEAEGSRELLTQRALKLLPELFNQPLVTQLWAARRVLLTAELLAITLDATLTLEGLDRDLKRCALLSEASALSAGQLSFVIELRTLSPTQRGAGQRLGVTLLLEPLGERGPRLRAGEGAALSLHKVTTEEGEERLCGLKRSFDEEREALTSLSEHLKLTTHQVAPDQFELALEPAIELIRELDELDRESSGLISLQEKRALGLRVEWPNLDTWAITETLDERSLQLSIRKVRGGAMSLSGQLNLGDFGSARLKDINPLLLDSPSPYVQLPSGVFLSLTAEFLHRLQALELSSPDGRATPTSASVIDELKAAQAEVKASQAWLDSVERMRSAEHLSLTLPEGINATLRSYQLEGFEWMSRLAHWGGGACLADDMGLGKTIQALSVALSRAPGGPALVVAPTSVCGAWIEEAARFTPQLRVTRFGIGAVASTSARKKALETLGPSDLIICSYGLLGSEREALTAIQWHTIILDEAQAIKSPSSLRHRAAIELKGDFKLAMTGTPIENHLRDLWSLMRFLNPGLLGDLKRFKSTFEQPIEQRVEGSERRSSQLKQLVAPFVLRRTKREVLKELPPKTELNLTVTLSDQEAAQYEALRAIAVGELRDQLKASQAGILPHIFKVLTKLRLACCHPSLISESWSGPSAKFDQFKRIINQLREGGHKALVFSQFVKHLDIIEGWVKAEGIRYERLDGSTPAEQRDAAVERFQRGEAELFLISLRAGGVGLTLTEADYVIHMDPWWNPAVEDQATNRAHRIGQDKPVTLYRLITQGTIEERILALHHHKRNLADQVLDGANGESAVGLDEWLKLLDLDAEGDLLPSDASVLGAERSTAEQVRS